MTMDLDIHYQVRLKLVFFKIFFQDSQSQQNKFLFVRRNRDFGLAAQRRVDRQRRCRQRGQRRRRRRRQRQRRILRAISTSLRPRRSSMLARSLLPPIRVRF